MIDFAAARLAMVENQLRPSRINDPGILDAMGSIPRERFLPQRLRGVAYRDEDIDLGDGRHLVEPLVLGKLLQSARPDPKAAALVIGCDTGYCTAVLARLAATAFHLCPDEASQKAVEAHLEAVGSDNAIVQVGEYGAGLPEQAPFGTILLVGSVPALPSKLTEQLDQGGRLAAVVSPGRAGHVMIAERVGDAIGERVMFDAATPSLRMSAPEPAFVF